MLTPEGHVKNEVKKIFILHKPRLYAHWPVQNGMGAPTLDCIGVVNSFAFAIETKAPGKKPTPRQQITIDQMREAGCKVFVIDGAPGLTELSQWLSFIANTTEQE